MSPKQIKQILKQYTTKPGYILDLTRVEFEDMFDEIDVYILTDEEYQTYGKSVAKLLKRFLEIGTEDHITIS